MFAFDKSCLSKFLLYSLLMVGFFCANVSAEERWEDDVAKKFAFCSAFTYLMSEQEEYNDIDKFKRISKNYFKFAVLYGGDEFSSDALRQGYVDATEMIRKKGSRTIDAVWSDVLEVCSLHHLRYSKDIIKRSLEMRSKGQE